MIFIETTRNGRESKNELTNKTRGSERALAPLAGSRRFVLYRRVVMSWLSVTITLNDSIIIMILSTAFVTRCCNVGGNVLTIYVKDVALYCRMIILCFLNYFVSFKYTYVFWSLV